MFNIVILESTYNKIDIFINWFSWNFVKMYTDTWIYNEDLIQNSYIELWDRLRNLIISEIRKIFTEKTIYWISHTKEWKQFTTISINNFRLFVYYEEIKDEKLRIIEDIEFFRK